MAPSSGKGALEVGLCHLAGLGFPSVKWEWLSTRWMSCRSSAVSAHGQGSRTASSRFVVADGFLPGQHRRDSLRTQPVWVPLPPHACAHGQHICFTCSRERLLRARGGLVCSFQPSRWSPGFAICLGRLRLRWFSVPSAAAGCCVQASPERTWVRGRGVGCARPRLPGSASHRTAQLTALLQEPEPRVLCRGRKVTACV